MTASEALARYAEATAKRHEAAVARGEHDGQCEWRAPGFYLCHCSKRRREAIGFTKPPAEALYFAPPACPRCGNDVDHDGEGWQCYVCRISWDPDGTGAEFTDDYGDDLAEDLANWEAKWAAQDTATPTTPEETTR